MEVFQISCKRQSTIASNFQDSPTNRPSRKFAICFQTTSFISLKWLNWLICAVKLPKKPKFLFLACLQNTMMNCKTCLMTCRHYANSNEIGF
ncbi:hypothetical protein, variant [Batrachochytrium dendrobatidis JEL423]|uniref:Uncharacterized protein n=1 Tax=Batrachochytrium dendrobatidis (strain JEL423) TaxID=403673 RepID=A0A177WK69_BATDL|nr:hypothetical protein, variant [Batrachochytrium dendrobatidis JEL423]